MLLYLCLPGFHPTVSTSQRKPGVGHQNSYSSVVSSASRAASAEDVPAVGSWAPLVTLEKGPLLGRTAAHWLFNWTYLWPGT